MNRDKELLDRTEKILKEDVAPNADQIDLHPLRKGIDGDAPPC
jgi:hypothetical protein